MIWKVYCRFAAGFWRKRLADTTVMVPMISFWLVSCGPDAGISDGRLSIRDASATRDLSRTNVSDPEIRILTTTFLKASPLNASELDSGDKCTLQTGRTLFLDGPAQGWGRHWKVILKKKIAGCDLREGYLFEEHVALGAGGESSYTPPLPGSFVTSDWCVCRSVGTSPHIGLDLAKGGSMRSVALSDGRVEDVVFVPSCGWEVRLRDHGGALWSYLHLDKPAVNVGQVLHSGALIGRHESYPRSGCGTGPHLHLERLSAGAFRDQAAGRTCQGVFRSCNYDPRSAFPGVFSDVEDDLRQTVNIPFDAEPSAQQECSPYQPEPKLMPLSIDRDFPAEPMSSFSFQIKASVVAVVRETQKPLLKWSIALQDVKGNVNEGNACEQPQIGNEPGCIASYELFIELSDGQVLRVAQDQDARNQALQMVADARYCSPHSGAARYGIRAMMDSGEELKTWGRIQLEGEVSP